MKRNRRVSVSWFVIATAFLVIGMSGCDMLNLTLTQADKAEVQTAAAVLTSVYTRLSAETPRSSKPTSTTTKLEYGTSGSQLYATAIVSDSTMSLISNGGMGSFEITVNLTNYQDHASSRRYSGTLSTLYMFNYYYPYGLNLRGRVSVGGGTLSSIEFNVRYSLSSSGSIRSVTGTVTVKGKTYDISEFDV